MATDSTCLGGNSASVPNSFIQLRHMRWKTFRECSTRPPAKLLWNFVLAGASKKSVASNRSNSESEPVLCIYFWYAEMKVSFGFIIKMLLFKVVFYIIGAPQGVP